MKNEPIVRTGLLSSWGRFWFNPVDPIGLHLVRLATGLLLFFWLLPMAGRQNEFFGLQGWFDRQAFKEAKALPADQGLEPISWSLLYAVGGNPNLVSAFYYTSLGIVALFTLGIATRITAPLTWLVLGSFLCNPAISYEAEYLLMLLLFYLMIGYGLMGLWNGPGTLKYYLLGSCAGQAWKLWPHETTADEVRPSVAANLALRLIQVNFAIVIFISALHKLQFGEWWMGMALWFPLHPPMTTTVNQLRTEALNRETYFVLLSLASYLMLAWQLAFPFIAWRRSLRAVLVGGALIGWIGSIAIYRIPLFGPIVLIASLSYITAAEWRSLGKWLLRLGQVFRKNNETAVEGELVSPQAIRRVQP